MGWAEVSINDPHKRILKAGVAGAVMCGLPCLNQRSAQEDTESTILRQTTGRTFGLNQRSAQEDTERGIQDVNHLYWFSGNWSFGWFELVTP